MAMEKLKDSSGYKHFSITNKFDLSNLNVEESVLVIYHFTIPFFSIFCFHNFKYVVKMLILFVLEKANIGYYCVQVVYMSE